ncbi:HAD-IA family hydrolase [Streptomyces yunnanensis]|uniref:Hydrolase of the HAD superfamily n=1 Tax=Streptomyces yunnanensis TaxID=156453 RepID=A0A9X8N4N8_9ACTN|nr:HAD-IA family hydrolase [Streptomyces yunnanensis]SHM94683.1 putative hydrolase of the HAD superfamily [Streptomyces yunnanensis]
MTIGRPGDPGDPDPPAILIDIGGGLAPDHLPAAGAEWGDGRGIPQHAFLAALFAGNDDQVLIGRMGQEAWWRIVRRRLGADSGLMAELRRDLAARRRWDADLVAGVRALRGRARTVLVSNAWPEMRPALAASGMLDVVAGTVLSCEVGRAKPDPRIYASALRRAGVADPARALFVDDTVGHVRTALARGMAGHLHIDTGGTLAQIEEFVRAVGAG